MYCLQAIIATEKVLSESIGTIKGAHVVPLDRHLSLVPLTDTVLNAVATAGTQEADVLGAASIRLDQILVACSADGPVAYVEADFFGGGGEQFAQVWDHGAVVLGPLTSGEDDPFAAAGTPISQALRRLGVARGDHYDEFAAVGLGRHRHTNDWLPRTH